MGAIGRDDARVANALFEDVVRSSFSVLLPSSEDYDQAKRYLLNFNTGLRAGDALHLAIAGNHYATAIYTLDKEMQRAGKVLGLPVSAGI